MATKAKDIIQNLIIGVISALALFTTVIVLTYSYAKIALISAILITGVLWIISRGKFRRALKVVALFTMIFGVVFGGLEAYAFQNAGYPRTFSPSESIGMQTMLNASLTEIVQGIEQSAAFSVLRLEHGEPTLESINLSPFASTGGIEVEYFIGDTHSDVTFASSGGNQYHVSITRLIGTPFSEKYSSNRTTSEVLSEFDELKLGGFYDEALQIARNRTADLPAIDSLSFEIRYDNYKGYQGLMLTLIGSSLVQLPDGTTHHPGALIAAFQPNGTLLYMSQPAPPK